MAIDRGRGDDFGYLPLRVALDRLFEGSFISPQSFGGGSSGRFPPADLFTTENDVVLKMAVPGANPEDINVSVTGDTVTVSGHMHHEHHTGAPSSGQTSGQTSQGAQGQTGGQQGQNRPGHQHFIEEIWQGSFQRTFTLPIEVDANKANAGYHNGILTLILPKSEATKPRKIQVQPGQSQISQGQGGRNVQTEKVPIQSGSSGQSS